MTRENFTRHLGQTGLQVSPIGLGTVKFGRTTGLKYPDKFALPDEKSLGKLLALAWDLGINLIDTAPAYGTSEQSLGKLLKAQSQQWNLCTKVGEYHKNGHSYYDFSEEATRQSIETSLRNLKTEALDMVLVHSNGQDRSIIQQTDVFETLHKLKDQGLVKNLGMSTKTVDGGLLIIDDIDVLMITLNESDQSQTELIKVAQQKNKGVLIKKALDSGFANDVSQALDFAVNFPGVTSVIVGTINPHHLKQNVESLTH